MSLPEAFDALLEQEEPLAGLDELIWQNLAAAVEGDGHAWKEVFFSTVESIAEESSDAHETVGTGKNRFAPRTRTVILRRAHRETLTIDFHTDVRSAKVSQLGRHAAQVAWLFYGPATKVQLRVEGTATVLNGQEADRAWEVTPLLSRSSYLSTTPPGTREDGRRPPDTSDRLVEPQESERGRVNFRIVRTTVQRLDWLYLKRQGHVRAAIDYTDLTDSSGGQRPTCNWLVP